MKPIFEGLIRKDIDDFDRGIIRWSRTLISGVGLCNVFLDILHIKWRSLPKNASIITFMHQHLILYLFDIVFLNMLPLWLILFILNLTITISGIFLSITIFFPIDVCLLLLVMGVHLKYMKLYNSNEGQLNIYYNLISILNDVLVKNQIWW